MKKTVGFGCLLTGAILLGLSVSEAVFAIEPVVAVDSKTIKANQAAQRLKSDTWLDIHVDNTNTLGFGLAKELSGNVWAGLGIDGLDTKVKQANADIFYKAPRKLLIFEPYFGGGLDYYFDTATTGSHITLGAKILCFFAEEELKLGDRENTHKVGLRFSF